MYKYIFFKITITQLIYLTLLISTLYITSNGCVKHTINLIDKKKIYYPQHISQYKHNLIIITHKENINFTSSNILYLNIKQIHKQLQQFNIKNIPLTNRSIKQHHIIQYVKKITSLSNNIIFIKNTNQFIISTAQNNKLNICNINYNNLNNKLIYNINSLITPNHLTTFKYKHKNFAILASKNSSIIQIININKNQQYISNKNIISYFNLNLILKHIIQHKQYYSIQDIKITYTKNKPTIFVLLNIYSSIKSTKIINKKAIIIWFKINKHIIYNKIFNTHINVFNFTNLHLGTYIKTCYSENNKNMYIVLHNPNYIINLIYINKLSKYVILKKNKLPYKPNNIIITNKNIFITSFYNSMIIKYKKCNFTKLKHIQLFGYGAFSIYIYKNIYVTYYTSRNIGIFNINLNPIGYISLNSIYNNNYINKQSYQKIYINNNNIIYTTSNYKKNIYQKKHNSSIKRKQNSYKTIINNLYRKH